MVERANKPQLWTSSATTDAAAYGYSSLFQWLVDNACPVDTTEVLHLAASAGNMAIIQRLEDKIESDTNLESFSAQGKNFDSISLFLT